MIGIVKIEIGKKKTIKWKNGKMEVGNEEMKKLENWKF